MFNKVKINSSTLTLETLAKITIALKTRLYFVGSNSENLRILCFIKLNRLFNLHIYPSILEFTLLFLSVKLCKVLSIIRFSPKTTLFRMRTFNVFLDYTNEQEISFFTES